MIETNKLIQYLNQLLQPQLFADYCPNGLQIAGQSSIKQIISGVSASQALLDAAIDLKADAVLVHHGYFWKGENPCVIGIKQKRLSAILKHQINLIAYHLPLDAHDIYGNNIQLAAKLDLVVDGEFAVENSVSIGRKGHLQNPMPGMEFATYIEQQLSRKPLYIPGKAAQIHSIAWCTGAAQDNIEEAITAGVDAYLTGEVSERTVLIARESGLHFFAAGHHATERYGVHALGEHLAKKFNLSHQFIDIDNPV